MLPREKKMKNSYRLHPNLCLSSMADFDTMNHDQNFKTTLSFYCSLFVLGAHLSTLSKHTKFSDRQQNVNGCVLPYSLLKLLKFAHDVHHNIFVACTSERCFSMHSMQIIEHNENSSSGNGALKPQAVMRFGVVAFLSTGLLLYE